jgi:hypothetical protein
LSKHVQSRYFVKPRSPEAQRACDMLISVIGGFFPLREVRETFLLLYSKEGFEEYGAQLFVGLCAFSPTRYPMYVKRFVQLVDRFPDAYRLDHVLREFVQIVSPATFADHVKDLNEAGTSPFISLVLNHVPDIAPKPNLMSSYPLQVPEWSLWTGGFFRQQCVPISLPNRSEWHLATMRIFADQAIASVEERGIPKVVGELYGKIREPLPPRVQIGRPN